MITIKFNGKEYKFRGSIEPGLTYRFVIEGHDIYVTTTERYPEICGQLEKLGGVKFKKPKSRSKSKTT